MGTRVLTGKWYLKKRLFGGFRLMVETNCTTTCPYDFSESPEFKTWEKANDKDIVALNINAIL